MILFQVPPAPVPFWESSAFTTAVVLLIGAVMAYFQSRTTAKVDKTAAKVDTIETHTNGMLTALQNKVDLQEKDRMHLAEITEKDKQIASLTVKPDVPTP